MTTVSIIQPILYATYGKGGMVNALASTLVDRVDDFVPNPRVLGGADRECVIMQACWSFFPGGDTAATVAKKIEAALTATETEER